MDFYKVIQQLDKNKQNMILTILTGKYIGAKLIISNGEIIYTDNEAWDWDVIRQSIPLDKKTQIIDVQGEKVFVEFLGQRYKIVLCGAGHVAISVIQLCQLLSLPVTVIDDRPSFINKAIEAGADKVICQPFEKALNKISGDKSTFFIIVTRGHRYDQICLEKIIQKESAYTGMIGSKVRVRRVLNDLEKKGMKREKLEKVYTPIGLKIGAETPAEIAISIMSEIIGVKNKVKGSNMYSKEFLNGVLNENYKDLSKAVVTIVSRKGSAPRQVGTRMIVLSDGTLIGTIGGGCVEANLRQSALNSISNGKPQLLKVDMTGTDAEEEGMVCGGIIEAFIDTIRS